jgi:hypothetical protein
LRHGRRTADQFPGSAPFETGGEDDIEEIEAVRDAKSLRLS